MIHDKFYACLEKLLHAKSHQEHPFKNPVSAKAIVDRIWKHAGIYYTVVVYAVLSNHVHLQLGLSIQCPPAWDGIQEIPEYRGLAQIIGAIKGGCAHDVNIVLGRKGQLWKQGYYDRYMRNQHHLTNEVWYILRNAEKAGLVDCWREHPFTYGEPNLVD